MEANNPQALERETPKALAALEKELFSGLDERLHTFQGGKWWRAAIRHRYRALEVAACYERGPAEMRQRLRDILELADSITFC